MELIGDLWDLIINRPMINSLVFLYWVFFSNFGLSIIVFTILTRLLMVPLTLRQLKMTRAMSDLAPKAQEITEKYKDDPQRRSQETMKLYRESGVNPVGCLGPLVLQMPIFIGLFWALRSTLASTPESLADLATKLYPWLPGVGESIPIDPFFLGLDLGLLTSAHGIIGTFLALIVAGSTWLMQKMSTSKATSPQQEQTSKMLLWFMPIMIGVFSLQFETGLTIYWTVSNIVGIIVQGFIGGWGQVREAFSFGFISALWASPRQHRRKSAHNHRQIRTAARPRTTRPTTARFLSPALVQRRQHPMNSVEMTGKTPEEAIEFALKELDAERGEVEIDVVNRGKSGILGIGGEPARVRVTLIEQPSDLARIATEVLEDLIERMDVLASVHLKQAYNEEVDGPIIEVDGEDSGLLIGRRGETLRALQFIVSFICAKRMGERVNLFVDVAGYQERRYNSLRNLARRVAQRVADGGRPITLEPMPPNERRIVHLTLANDPNVTTASVGHGDQRQVVVESQE